jgi:hypothetical protein
VGLESGDAVLVGAEPGAVLVGSSASAATCSSASMATVLVGVEPGGEVLVAVGGGDVFGRRRVRRHRVVGVEVLIGVRVSSGVMDAVPVAVGAGVVGVACSCESGSDAAEVRGTERVVIERREPELPRSADDALRAGLAHRQIELGDAALHRHAAEAVGAVLGEPSMAPSGPRAMYCGWLVEIGCRAR